MHPVPGRPILPVTPTQDLHRADVPAVPQPQEPYLPAPHITRLQRIVNLFPPGQFLRYLCVGGFNTAFGYSTAAGTLFLLNHHLPSRFLYLTVPAASILSTPLNITVAYFGYKLFDGGRSSKPGATTSSSGSAPSQSTAPA